MINHQFHIDSCKDKNFGYNMIIGQDLMKKFGVIIYFKNKILILENIIVPMWRSGSN